MGSEYFEIIRIMLQPSLLIFGLIGLAIILDWNYAKRHTGTPATQP